MLCLYTSSRRGSGSEKETGNDLRYCYYSGILTAMTSVIAIVIGVIQILSLVQNVLEPEGSFWDGVAAVGDDFDIIGGAIVGGFVVVAGVSVLLYGRFKDGLRGGGR